MSSRDSHCGGLDDRLWASFNWTHALFFFGLITFVLFSDVILFNDGRMLSAKGLDLFSGEMSGLEFLYGELKQGRLALWNPHLFSGTSMLTTPLYPFQMICLFLPITVAVNVIIALHVFLAGFFMYLWTSYRKLHSLACLSSGVLFMFSGPFFMHIYAGHLGNLCAMAWAPLIFLTIDGMMDRPSPGWSLLSIFAVTMQILTSQFQYIYYTAVAAVIYIVLRIATTPNRFRVLLGLCSIPAGSLLLSAFHWMPVILSVGEGVRTKGMSAQFASMFSFPPENLITCLSPLFFGDIRNVPYWGRCYLWEMSVFFTITGVFLAIWGAVRGERQIRRFSLSMAVMMMILALGAHTPLFQALYEWLPGFNKFRGTSKFLFQTMLFLAILAGIGLDHLIRKGKDSGKLGMIALGGAAILGVAAFWITHDASSLQTGPNIWGKFLGFIDSTGESYLLPKAFHDASFLTLIAEYASQGLMIGSATALVLALCFYLIRYSNRAIYLVVILMAIEACVFASHNRVTFNYKETDIVELKQFFANRPGDYRVLKLQSPNTAMSTGSADIWGYGPAAMGRYVQFMAFTQGENPDTATTYLRINKPHRLFTLLRLKYIFVPDHQGFTVHEIDDVMPRLSLLQNWKVAVSRDDAFREMSKPTFDPRKTVILEKAPKPSPISSEANGKCIVLDESSSHLTVKAELPSPSILLITENYSRGWRVKPLNAGMQQTYNIYPADYTLMAIPLDRGEHLFRFEYRPQVFVIGVYMSLISLILYIVCGLWLVKRKFYAG